MRGNHFFLKRALLAALLLTAASAAAQSAGSESGPEAMKGSVLKARIEKLDGEIQRVELQLNRLTWETYLDYAEQARITPKVFSLPGLNYARLRDTVPAIDTLRQRLRAASMPIRPSCVPIRSTKRSIRSMWRSAGRRIRSVSRPIKCSIIAYARLRANNPDYEPALERRKEAERQRNMAILRYMVDYYGAKGLDPADRTADLPLLVREQGSLNGRCPEIGRLSDEPVDVARPPVENSANGSCEKSLSFPNARPVPEDRRRRVCRTEVPGKRGEGGSSSAANRKRRNRENRFRCFLRGCGYFFSGGRQGLEDGPQFAVGEDQQHRAVHIVVGGRFERLDEGVFAFQIGAGHARGNQRPDLERAFLVALVGPGEAVAGPTPEIWPFSAESVMVSCPPGAEWSHRRNGSTAIRYRQMDAGFSSGRSGSCIRP